MEQARCRNVPSRVTKPSSSSSLDDWVPPTHPVRFVAAWLDGLDAADRTALEIDLTRARQGEARYAPPGTAGDLGLRVHDRDPDTDTMTCPKETTLKRWGDARPGEARPLRGPGHGLSRLSGEGGLLPGRHTGAGDRARPGGGDPGAAPDVAGEHGSAGIGANGARGWSKRSSARSKRGMGPGRCGSGDWPMCRRSGRCWRPRSTCRRCGGRRRDVTGA